MPVKTLLQICYQQSNSNTLVAKGGLRLTSVLTRRFSVWEYERFLICACVQKKERRANLHFYFLRRIFPTLAPPPTSVPTTSFPSLIPLSVAVFCYVLSFSSHHSFSLFLITAFVCVCVCVCVSLSLSLSLSIIFSLLFFLPCSISP